VNFPGEFGGGVINLTTKAIPSEPFLSISGGIGGDSETTGQLGYTYYGSKSDWTGFDNGSRDRPSALKSYFRSGRRISEGGVDTQAIAGQLITGRNSIVQTNNDIPPNWSASVSGGTSFEIGSDVTLGVIANFAYSNKWRTRDTIQQTPATQDLSQLEQDFRRVITDDRVVVNGLVGYGLEWGENKVRWTNVYIRDTLKQARLGQGTKQTTNPNATFLQQSTAWFERQLTNTQLTGEFKLTDRLSLDLRGSFANSQREAPDEIDFEYFRSNLTSDPFGEFFINRLNNGQQGNAGIAFSDLNETLWSAGADLSYKVTPDITTTIGYAFSDTDRRTERREFLILAPSSLPTGVAMLRPDLLLSKAVIDFYGIGLIDTNEANPVFDARLRNHGAYAQISAQVTPEVNVNAGVRYETAKQTVNPVQVFDTPTASLAGTNLDRDYFLPAATLTYQLNDDMQVRLNASKTIARPQFRELIFQPYFDPDSNRLFRGNPLLVDSQLTNFEGRFEWYYAPRQRLSVSGFFKKIKNPIETFASANETGILSSFANAPSAILWGAELEAVKHFDLDWLGDSEFWSRRRLQVIGNYTYTQSELRVGANDSAAVFNQSANRATDYFRNGAPLTGQSDHLLNLEIGLEDRDALSQQTFLLSYASKRVTNRGANGQPDILERPGIQLDFVARQGIKLFGIESEAKLEVRNITGQGYREYQRNRDNVVFYNAYDVGTSVSLGWSVNF
jgi:outer membrane receptor protein involved in Fe transport